MSRNVKKRDLKRSLLRERRGFAPWDNGRRNKVDIVIEAINRNKDDADLHTLQNTVVEVTNENDDLKELRNSAIKMLRIHYKRLGRTPEQKREYQERREKALLKIQRYEEKHKVTI